MLPAPPFANDPAFQLILKAQKRNRDNRTIEIQDSQGCIIGYPFLVASPTVPVANHKRHPIKAQVKLLRDQPDVAQADKRTYLFNGIESGSTEELRETHYWRLEQKWWDGKIVQLRFVTNIALANLIHKDDAIGTKWFPTIPDKKCQWIPPSASESNETHPDGRWYSSISDRCEERFEL